MNCLSVIIPVFNAASTVQQTLDSVFRQKDIVPFVVCVDDGSRDKSACVIDSNAYFNEDVIVIHSQNGGVSVARNLALSIASTEYVTFVDSDDTVSGVMYRDMLGYLQGNDLDCVTCGINRIYPHHSNSVSYVQNDTVISPRSAVLAVLQSSLFEDGAGGGVSPNFINSVCLSIFRKSIIFQNKIAFHVGRKTAEDWEFYIDYLWHCNRVGILHHCYYNYYRRITDSASNRYSDWFPFALEDRKKFMRYFPNVDWKCRMAGYMLLPLEATANVRVYFSGSEADERIKEIFHLTIQYGVFQHEIPVNCSPREQKIICDLKATVEANDYRSFKRITYKESNRQVVIRKLKKIIKKVIAR